MSYGKASHTLVKDLLFSFICKTEHSCFRCGLPLTRDTFSIDHIEPWLDSEDPVKSFFDLGNISFSHISCNSKAARRPHRIYNDLEEARSARNESQKRRRKLVPIEVRKQKRKEKYLNKGY